MAPKGAPVQALTGYAGIDLAAMKLEEQDSTDAENITRQVITKAVELKDADVEARGADVLALALLAQGKVEQTQQAIDHAASLLQPASEDDSALEIAITAALVSKANSHSPVAARQSVKRLEDIIHAASVQGDVGVRFDAGLAKAAIELESGQIAVARAELAALRREAHTRNFGLAERRTTALLAPPFPKTHQ